jgi:hypothetical protein
LRQICTSREHISTFRENLLFFISPYRGITELPSAGSVISVFADQPVGFAGATLVDQTSTLRLLLRYAHTSSAPVANPLSRGVGNTTILIPDLTTQPGVLTVFIYVQRGTPDFTFYPF